MIYIGKYGSVQLINTPTNEKDLQKEIDYLKRLESYDKRWRRIYINGEKSDYAISNHGEILDRKTNTYVKQHIDRTKKVRYIRVTLRHKKESYAFSVHRLVATYFLKPKKHHKNKNLTIDQLYPNHKDGVKNHNAAFNLEWVTSKENSDHAWETGLNDAYKGENSHLAKMTEKEAKQIISLIMESKTNKEIKEIMNTESVTLKSIQHIRAKECWKYLTKDLKFPKLLDATPYSIPDEKVHEICKLLEEKKYKDTEIGKMMGVNRELVRDIRNHRRRTSISMYYDF